MQICTSLQTDNHTSTQFFIGRMPFLPPSQQRQSTEGTTYLASYVKKNKQTARSTGSLSVAVHIQSATYRAAIGDAENAGLENAGLENAGTSCVWVAKCNIINVRGHVRVNVTISDFANHVFVTWKV